MILIIGASGAVGTPLIKQLADRGINTMALTSSDSSRSRLKKLGVNKAVIGDFRVDSDVNNVMKDATNVCYIPPRFKEDEFEIGKRIIDAAKVMKVEHFLFCSAYHPQIQDMGHHWQKLMVEQYLINSNLMHTVVQPSMFMQNLSVEWARVINEGIYARPYSSDSQMNVIDTDDLAEAMANILTNSKFWGATYELCGSGTITHNDMAGMITDTLGKEVRAVHRDIEEWKVWAQERNWTEYAIENYVRMCEHYNLHGFGFGNDIVLKAILGRPATDYPTFIKKFITIQDASSDLSSN